MKQFLNFTFFVKSPFERLALGIVFFIITSISIPNIILILQDLDHLPYWINGFDNKSYYFNWIF